MRREFYNDQKTASGLFLAGCEFENCGEPFFRYTEPSDLFRIFSVSEGEGVIEADGKAYSAQKGDVFVFKPGVSVKYSSEGADALWSFCEISFGGSDAEFYLSESGVTGGAVQKKTEGKAFFSSVMKCLDLCEGRKERVPQADLTGVLLEAISSLRPRRSSKVRLRASEQTDKAQRYIEQNYMHGITARDVTAELNIDRTHFFRIFKARTGLSPEQYIMKFRMKKAKEL